MIVKNESELQALREGGRRLAFILYELRKKVAPGIATKNLDKIAYALIKEGGDEPAFLNYTPYGAKRPFPATLCVSINDEIIHGIPTENSRILNEGDIVSLDLGLKHGGFFVDNAITVGVGEVDDAAFKLIQATKLALEIGISKAIAKNNTNDIGRAIEEYSKTTPFSIALELGGHGLGKKVHEEPFVPNYFVPRFDDQLMENMVIAIEPMFCEGSGFTKIDDDGYTFRTKDGGRSAHFEHTVVVGKSKAEILTKLD